MIIYQITNNEQKLKTFLVNGTTLKLVYPKDQYLARISTFIQHFCLWSVFNSSQYLLCKLCRRQHSLHYQRKCRLCGQITARTIRKQLKLNLDKCHIIVSGTENAKIKLDDFTITNSNKEKLLGVIFDDRLSSCHKKKKKKINAYSLAAAAAFWFKCAIANTH